MGFRYGLVSATFRVIDWNIINTASHQQMNQARHGAGFLISDTMCYIITYLSAGPTLSMLGA